MPVDHAANLALVTRHLRGRSDVRAGKALYDDALTLEGNDPRSRVAQAAAGVLALHAAGAVDDAHAAKALAALTSAWQAVQSLRR